MSYRKTKLIQERNLILERKYVLEQAPPSPPAPIPSGGTTGTTTPQTSTSSPTQKFDKKFIESLPKCSDIKSPDNPEEIKQDGFTLLKDPKGKMPYCKHEKK